MPCLFIRLLANYKIWSSLILALMPLPLEFCQLLSVRKIPPLKKTGRIVVVLGFYFFSGWLLESSETDKQTEATHAAKEEEAPDLPNVAVVETPYSLVVADTYTSANYVSELSRFAVEVLRRFVPVRDRFRNQLLIQLIPVEKSSFSAPYFMQYSKAGKVTVSINWGADTKFSDLCQALARGVIQTWIIHLQGVEVAGKTLAWFDLAMGLELQRLIYPPFLFPKSCIPRRLSSMIYEI